MDNGDSCEEYQVQRSFFVAASLAGRKNPDRLAGEIGMERGQQRRDVHQQLALFGDEKER